MKKRKYDYYRSRKYEATTKERMWLSKKGLTRKQRMLHLNEGANTGSETNAIGT